MKIVSKRGDEGNTYLGKKRVKKSSSIIEAIGSLDELNSSIGIARSFIKDKRINNILKQIQKHIFIIGNSIFSEKYKFDSEKIKWIENKIDEFEKKLPELNKFILPAGSKESALLQFSRSLVRRAERRVVKIKDKQKIQRETIIYLNRLSDMLFLIARFLNKEKEEYV